MSSPRVSVVIPAYNCARFLERAVTSALAQSEAGELQIVIVDDGSTDTTAEVMTDLARRHPQVEAYANAQNSGPGATRNRGIAEARGEWVALLDADDAFGPGRLARLIVLAEAEGLEVLADLPVMYDLAADCPAPDQLAAPGGVRRLDMIDFLQPDPATELDLGLLKPVFRRRLADDGLWQYPQGIRHGEDCALYIALTQQGIGFGLAYEAHYLFSTRIGAISGTYSPGSVTVVDYLGIARQLTALRDQLAASDALDPQIDALIDTRRAATLRQNRIYGWTALRKRDWPRLKTWLAQDRDNQKALARMIWAKLTGHRGLPD